MLKALVLILIAVAVVVGVLLLATSRDDSTLAGFARVADFMV